MTDFFRVALYSIASLYVFIVLSVSFVFICSLVDSPFPFNSRFDILIPLGLVMLYLGIDYNLKKGKSIKDKMKFLLYLFFVPCIFPLISVLIFAIFNDNYLYGIVAFIPIGLIAAILFLIVNYFLEINKNKKSSIVIRSISLIPIFMIATMLYVLIASEPEGIIGTLKIILDMK
jgi:amino acid permease